MEIAEYTHTLPLVAYLLGLSFLTAQERYAKQRLLLYRAWANASWAILSLMIGESLKYFLALSGDPEGMVFFKP